MKKVEERSPKGLLFEKLVNQKRNKVYYIAYSFFQNADDAQEIVQEVFQKAWEHLDSLKDEAKAGSWVISIAYNVCRNYKKRRRIFEELDETMATPSNDTTIKDRVRREIITLDAEKKMAIILLEYEGMTYREIADAMNKSESAVKSIIFRAREELREHLKDLMPRRKNETH